MSSFRYVVCDVFTDTPLTGNQLAVFTDARELPEERLQELAREMNFSETVFVYPATAEGAHARIRIFTPGIEVPFAGHPTLGSAFVLAGPLQLGEIRLETGSGVVPVRLEREGDGHPTVLVQVVEGRDVRRNSRRDGFDIGVAPDTGLECTGDGRDAALAVRWQQHGE